jgi:magnesium chelatase subunit I
MMIILQEANLSKSLITSSILKTLAKVAQKMRNSPQINQERGVSVRLGIHGLELLVGEAERTRALSKKMLPVPRISDTHCLNQVVKFELSELDDTIQNREKIFVELLNDAIKEICLEYLLDVDNILLESIKQDFIQQTFQVSQNLIWKNGQTSYSIQLEKFPNLKKLVELKLETIKSFQNTLNEQAKQHKINPKHVESSENIKDELYASLVEILLEGLCWTAPKILDKNEVGYVSS